MLTYTDIKLSYPPSHLIKHAISHICHSTTLFSSSLLFSCDCQVLCLYQLFLPALYSTLLYSTPFYSTPLYSTLLYSHIFHILSSGDTNASQVVGLTEEITAVVTNARPERGDKVR